jgi:hypothetical protein
MSTLKLAKKSSDFNAAPVTSFRKVDTAAPTNEVVGETKFGKEIEVYRTKVGKMFAVRFVGGGELPAYLQGQWCRFADAEEAAKVYLERNKSTLVPLPSA